MRSCRPWLVVGLAVTVTACSAQHHVEAPGFANGTRLAVRYDEVAGTRLLRTFYDRTRDEECSFQLLPGGAAACLPQSGLLEGTFADAACTDPLVAVLRVPAGRSTARALVTNAANACDAPPTVRALGEVVPAPDAYYLSSDGSCKKNAPDAKIVLQRIGDEVPLDRFVHATAEVNPVSAAVGAVVLVADDGARYTVFGNDNARGEWSHSLPLADGASHWSPVHVAFNYGSGAPGTPGSVYADAACSRPTGIKDAYNALCPITTVLEFVPADACQQFTTRLHQAGAPVATADLLAVASDGSCVASAAPGPANPVELYVEMGDALSDDTFPPATTVDVGDGRVVQRFDGTPDGVAVTARGTLHDNARNVDCFVALAADGVRRCLPGGGSLDAIFYGDADCTTPMMVMPAQAGCDDPTPPAEATYQGHAYPVGAALSPAMVYSVTTSGCGLVGPPPSYDRWFALGAEIPSSAYEPATLRTE